MDIFNYPSCLVEEMRKYRLTPSGNLEWDKAMLHTLRTRESKTAYDASIKLSNVVQQVDRDREDAQQAYPDLSDQSVYDMHFKLFMYIADNVVMAPQHRRFVVDDYNRDVIKFLMYYFNNCPLAEEVFPGRGYKLHKNIMLQGDLGVGKTMIMQCFSKYLLYIKSPRFFHNLSVTQMVNYYTIHNNLDRYTFYEEGNKGFMPKPENVCLNDVGINDDKVFYGMNTSVLTDEFLLARNDIWAGWDKFAHITTNLDEKALIARFTKGDRYGRLVDRFKTYNVIPLGGKSRR